MAFLGSQQKPLLIFGIRNLSSSKNSAFLEECEKIEEEGECSPFESLFAHFNLLNKIALVKKPCNSLEMTKEIYLLLWRKDCPVIKFCLGKKE